MSEPYMSTAHISELSQIIAFLNQGRITVLSAEVVLSTPDGKVGTVKKIDRKGYVFYPNAAQYGIYVPPNGLDKGEELR